MFKNQVNSLYKLVHLRAVLLDGHYENSKVHMKTFEGSALHKGNSSWFLAIESIRRISDYGCMHIRLQSSDRPATPYICSPRNLGKSGKIGVLSLLLFSQFCSWMCRLSTVPAAWRTDGYTVAATRPSLKSKQALRSTAVIHPKWSHDIIQPIDGARFKLFAHYSDLGVSQACKVVNQ